jgi:hypothetical protein
MGRAAPSGHAALHRVIGKNYRKDWKIPVARSFNLSGNINGLFIMGEPSRLA